MSVESEAGPCHLSDEGHCTRYTPGHNIHFIQARLIGEAPWGWRDAVVVTVDGLGFRLRYVAEDIEFDAWHHADLSAWLEPGMPVRVSRSAGTVLQATFGQVCIATNSPLAAVPTPEHPELWAAEMSGAVVDLATGRALNINDEFPDNSE